jgi:phage virion morphogenesis protein
MIEINDREVLEMLTRVHERIGDMRPLLAEIGEDMKAQTKKRFDTTTSPGGSPWLENSITTLQHKQGSTPLTGETGTLHSSIDYDVLSETAVEINAPKEYAAMQQFGGTKAEFPQLWGDIPARPFLGMSEDDKSNILDLCTDYLL